MKKILILLITLGLMVGCSDDATNGPVTIVPPHGGGSNPVLEDTLTTLYEFANLPADESIAKLEFFSDDSLKVTLADNSMLNSKTYIKSTIMKKTNNNNSKQLQKFQQQQISKPQLKDLKGGYIVEDFLDI